MRLHVLGVRGSTPSPGRDFARYGGNTSCVAIGRDGAAPSLLLDAGTGLRGLGALLGDQPFHGALLLGHLHWDHTQGLPFSPALDHDAAEVRLCLPDQEDGDAAVDVLRRAMSPPHFPIGPEGLRGRWTFEGLEPGYHHVAGFEVLALEIPHKGGRTYGYRISDDTSAVAYLSDHGPGALGPGPEGWGPYHDNAMALAAGVDLLVHDAQHTADELPTRLAWGHSAADYPVELARRAEAKAVLLYHHDPTRTDDEVDALVASFAGAPLPVTAAAEGATIQLGLS
ncbi:MAG: MBL fold metallo-hydrolase [Acidimicrobiales bacterium]|nr:MBL fold metallo-hydrolase [Acidimicrobiales bacterium]